MKKETTFLKMVLVLLGIPVLVLCGVTLMWLFKYHIGHDMALAIPIFGGLYLAALPFYRALFEAYRLLVLIDRGTAFSEASVKALKVIKYCAMAVAGIFTLIFPLVFLVAQWDDAPGLIVVGMIPIFVSLVMAVFAAVLQKLLDNAVTLKMDQELTI